MTIPHAVIAHLKGSDWIYGGKLSGEVGAITKHKASVVERRLREMANEGSIESRYVPNPNGKGSPVVQYKYKPTLADRVIARANDYQPKTLSLSI